MQGLSKEKTNENIDSYYVSCLLKSVESIVKLSIGRVEKWI